ncbi:hypothetical protein CSUI_002847 [Cystoisospora suis]|uniref:Uncharacterized protein n=1 Tax=Cystoisospora suis TaxID=483139 RepID=A0A2C6L7A2_9APIC|nr:hypothetical protein CSUI_002847 [Cystoisospora suis]
MSGIVPYIRRARSSCTRNSFTSTAPGKCLCLFAVVALLLLQTNGLHQPMAGAVSVRSSAAQKEAAETGPDRSRSRQSGSAQHVSGPNWTAHTVSFRTGAMRDLLESLLMADNAETLRVVLAEDTYPGFKVGLRNDFAESEKVTAAQKHRPQERSNSDKVLQANLSPGRAVTKTGSETAADETRTRRSHEKHGLPGGGLDPSEQRRIWDELRGLLADAKHHQEALKREWKRYDSLEAARLDLMEKHERQRSAARIQRSQLEEIGSEFQKRLENLQEIYTILETRSKAFTFVRAPRAPQDVRLGEPRGTEEHTPLDTLSEAGAIPRDESHQQAATDADSRSGNVLATMSTGEALELVKSLQELHREQRLLADFLAPLVSVQASRVMEQHRDVPSQWGISEAHMRHTRKGLYSAVSHIKKSPPRRVQGSLGDTRQKRAYAERSGSVREKPSRAEQPEESWVLQYGMSSEQHSHEGHSFQRQKEHLSNSKLGARADDSEGVARPSPPLSSSSSSSSPLSSTASCSPSPSHTLSARKGRRAVYGGFEALDDPPETVAAALVRFLSPPFAASAVSGLIQGRTRSRTQGKGGLAEATGGGKPEWLTDVTIFADAKLNEILEQEALAFELAPSNADASNTPEPDRGVKGRRPSPALAAVRRAETATAQADYFDRVEVLGPAGAKKKPLVGTVQEIIFQYAFDNVPLEHKRLLWREFLQAQLDDRGYDIELPEEPPTASVDPEGDYVTDYTLATEQKSHRRTTILDEMAWLADTGVGHGQTAEQMPNGLFQSVVEDELTRVPADGGELESDDTIPRVTLEELEELTRLGEEKEKLFPYWKAISKEVSASQLLEAIGLRRDFDLGTDAFSLWEESFESYSEDAELSQGDGEEDPLGWLWDIEFVAL